MSTKAPFWPKDWPAAGTIKRTHSSVDFNEDGSCYVEIRAGVKRHFPKDHRVTKMARNSLTLDLINAAKKENTRGGKGVTVYYRDESGKICLPPHPDMVPKGYDRLEAKGPSGQDRLTREMESDLRSQMREDGVTSFIEESEGNPSDYLRKMHYKSPLERELVGEMLKSLDREEEDRKRVSTSVTFACRESM